MSELHDLRKLEEIARTEQLSGQERGPGPWARGQPGHQHPEYWERRGQDAEEYACFLNSVDFIGKAALAERLKIPLTSSTVMLKVDTDNCDPEGDESVMMFGKAVGSRWWSLYFTKMLPQVGFTTSGCHSPALGSGLAMASVPVQLSAPGTRLQVSVSHYM